MKNKLFKGVYPASFSVYDENMKVIVPTVEKIAKWQLDNGVDGFYVGGATGECHVLPQHTRIEMLEVIKNAAGNRGHVFAHVGAGRMEDVIELTRHAESLGVDAISSLPPAMMPYYSDDEAVEYYKIIAKNTTKPIFAYVTPSIGNPVSFLEKVMEIDNVIGAKVTIRDCTVFQKVLQINGGDMNIFNGPDETMICGLALGADGAIGTTYNFAPKLAVGIYNDFNSCNIESARQKQNKLDSLIDYCIKVGKGACAYWKAYMTILGYDMGTNVAPGHTPTTEEIKKMEKDLLSLGLLDVQ